MQWGGSLGHMVDAASQINVEVRSFGSFDGSVPPGLEGAVPPLVLEAVRAALASNPKGLSADPRDIASAAQVIAASRLASMGLHGEITVTALTLSPEDHERIREVAHQAAMHRRAERMAAPEPAAGPLASAPFGVGAQVLVRWSDGQRYPGTVRELGPDQLHISFSDGTTHWVPLLYVSAS